MLMAHCIQLKIMFVSVFTARLIEHSHVVIVFSCMTFLFDDKGSSTILNIIYSVRNYSFLLPLLPKEFFENVDFENPFPNCNAS